MNSRIVHIPLVLRPLVGFVIGAIGLIALTIAAVILVFVAFIMILMPILMLFAPYAKLKYTGSRYNFKF